MRNIGAQVPSISKHYCDCTGSVGERYAYSAYGAPVFMTGAGTVQTSSPIGFETLYAGYRWDNPAPQMYYVRNRFLLPQVGTWNRRDPLGYVDGANLSTYSSHPIVVTDPSGFYGEPPWLVWLKNGGPAEKATTDPSPASNEPWWLSHMGGPGENCAACHPPQRAQRGSLEDPDGATCMVRMYSDCKSISGAGTLVLSLVDENCQCLRKAEELLRLHYDSVKTQYQGKSVFNLPLLMQDSGRNTLLALISNARRSCNGQRATALKFCCDDSCPDGRDAYVNFFVGTNYVTGDCIHLCPSFFKASRQRQRDIVLHEMGRMTNALGEELTGTWKDVYVWDDLLKSLCKNYEAIITRTMNAVL